MPSLAYVDTQKMMAKEHDEKQKEGDSEEEIETEKEKESWMRANKAELNKNE